MPKVFIVYQRQTMGNERLAGFFLLAFRSGLRLLRDSSKGFIVRVLASLNVAAPFLRPLFLRPPLQENSYLRCMELLLSHKQNGGKVSMNKAGVGDEMKRRNQNACNM